MTTPSPKDRTRAYRARKAIEAGTASADESAWLADYEDRSSGSLATASEKITLVEERSVAQADGAGVEAYAAASIAREDGRRVDTLTKVAIESMARACDMYARMASDLLSRSSALEAHSVALLDSMREHYLARIQAEGEAEVASRLVEAGGGGPEDALLAQLVANMAKAKTPITGG